MSYVTAAIDFARNAGRGEPTTVGERAYMPGSAGIPLGYIPFGVDSSQYAPEIYGEYASKSNPVYSCITQRASYLSALPLKLFSFSDEQSDLHMPRGLKGGDRQKHVLKYILDNLNGENNRSHRHFSRNAIGFLMGARSELDLLYKTRKMGMVETDSGPVFDLLRHVNPFWTLNRLLRMTQMSKDLWGEAYWFVERGENGRGTPREIWWAKPTQVYPVPDPDNYIAGYWYQGVNGESQEFFLPSEVIRIYNPNPRDEWQPLSPLAAARIYADHENTSMQANMNLHKRGLHPGAIVTPKGKMIWEAEQAEDIEDRINQRLGGYDKAHRWGVFRQDVELHQTSVTPKDSEFITGMEYDIQMVANAYHWPIDLLGGKRTYENVDQALKQAWQTVVLEAAFLADEIAEHLLPMFGTKAGVDVPFFDHSGVAVLQESETKRWERERTQIDVVFTRNEWRGDRGLEPKAGCDSLFVSNQQTPIDLPVFVTDKNLVPADTINEAPEEQPVPVPLNGDGA